MNTFPESHDDDQETNPDRGDDASALPLESVDGADAPFVADDEATDTAEIVEEPPPPGDVAIPVGPGTTDFGGEDDDEYDEEEEPRRPVLRVRTTDPGSGTSSTPTPATRTR